MVRFIHSADWQIGMRRWFLGEDSARFDDARLAAVRRIGELATEQSCEFVVVAGDVFEANTLERRTVGRLLAAVAEIPVPVLLLPGNHDHLGPGSIFTSTEFVDHRPENVIVLDDSTPIEVVAGVEVVGAPWRSKEPGSDLVTAAATAAEPRPGVLRIVVGHGGVDSAAQKFQLRVADLDRLITEHDVAYIALGDRHSTTPVGETGRVWYSGACEVTDFVEDAPGNVLVVELTAEDCRVTEHRVGSWQFVRLPAELRSAEDVTALARRLDELTPKDRTVVKLDVSGALSLTERVAYEDLLEQERAIFASLEESDGPTTW